MTHFWENRLYRQLGIAIFASFIIALTVFSIKGAQASALYSTSFKGTVCTDKQYNIVFDKAVEAETVLPENFYLNSERLTDDDISVELGADLRTVNFTFRTQLFNPGSEYSLTVDGIRYADGEYVNIAQLDAVGMGENRFENSCYLLYGDKKYTFNGRVKGTLSGESIVQNNSSDIKSFEVCFEIYENGVLAKEVFGDSVSIKPGEHKTVSADVDVSKQNDVFMYVRETGGGRCTQSVEVTKQRTASGMYLVEETFSDTLSDAKTGTPLLSGWSFDLGGGKVGKNSGELVINDVSLSAGVTAEKDFMAVTSGKITFETSCRGSDTINGFTIKLGGYRKKYDAAAVYLIFTKGYLNVYNGIERERISAYENDKRYNIKVVTDLDSKTYDVVLNGVTVAKGFGFFQAVDTICSIEFVTTDRQSLSANVSYVDAYTGYELNEKFRSSAEGSFSDEWQTSGNVRVSAIASGRTNDSLSANIINGSFAKQLNIADETEFGFSFMVKSGTFTGDFGGLNITVANNKLSVNGQQTADIIKNVWYDVKILKTQNNLNRVYVNGVLNDTVSVAIPQSVTVSFSGNGNVLVDDIYAFATYSYPEIKVENASDSGYDVHMLSYNMWREGTHFGWDRLVPYYERTPYLGYYDDGNRAAMDVQIKWLREHSVNTLVFPFVRDSSNAGNPIKRYLRDYALNDGYLNCDLSNEIKFAIMLSGMDTSNILGSDDFRNNVVPYLAEHYFRNPNYARIDNKAVIYMYTLSSFITVFGSEDNARAEIEYLNDYAKQLGYSGVYIISSCDANDDTAVKSAKNIGADATFLYSAPNIAGYRNTQSTYNAVALSAAQNNGLDFVPNVFMGYNDIAWRKSLTYGDGALTPRSFEALLSSVKNKIDNGECRLVALGVWNEFGEGHYFMPSNKYGYLYLDATEKVFGGKQYSSSDEMPGLELRNECGWLYMKNRDVEPLFDEIEYNPEQLSVIRQWDFSSSDTQGWAADSSASLVCKNGNLVIKSPKNTTPRIRIDLSGAEMNASRLKFLRIRMDAGSGQNGSVYGIMYLSTGASSGIYVRVPLYKDGIGTYVVPVDSGNGGSISEIVFWPIYFRGEARGELADVLIDSIEFLG